MASAVVLFSGGLDSMLAIRILQQQDVSITALNFITPFHDVSEDARKRAEHLGVPFLTHRMDDDYIKLIASPRFGYGKAVNPCIDCRIAMCVHAKKLMEETGADFVATGEVAGQRPNSQKMHQLSLISRESGLEGKIVRPLSAGVLPPSDPEIEGLIDRERLRSYTGRARGRLIRLGRSFDIGPIPQPSTGCFLCEKSFAPRVFDLFKYEREPSCWDSEVLSAGRQLRIDADTKIAIARNEAHCKRLEELFARKDARSSILYIPENYNGPSAILIGPERSKLPSEEFKRYLDLGASLVLRFSSSAKFDSENALLEVAFPGGEKTIIKAEPSEEAETFRVL